MLVKNIELGGEKPVICVSVMQKEQDSIVSEVRNLIAQGVEMLEWRVDTFAENESLNAIREVLQNLAPMIKDTIFVFTYRSKEQGGEGSLNQEQVYDLHQVAAESKVVDFIDVEYFYIEDADVEIQELQRMGAKIITSHHDFHETPPSNIMSILLEQMKHSGADVVKLAVMPNTSEDVLRLLAETNAFHKKYAKQLLITMAMGDLGKVTRVSGGLFGSCVTFGAGSKASAPGQIEVAKLRDILDVLSVQ